MVQREASNHNAARSSAATSAHRQPVPTPPWMRLETIADGLMAKKHRRVEQDEGGWFLTQILGVPSGLPLAGVHNIVNTQIVPSQAYKEIQRQNRYNAALEDTLPKDWSKPQTYDIFRRMPYANALYLPVPLARIPSHEPTVVVCFSVMYYPPMRDGGHLFRDVTKSATHVNGLNPEWDPDTKVSVYKAQCLIKGCGCGNMLFPTEYERNRHMDGCFDGRHSCTGCATIFHYYDDADKHVLAGCPASHGARVDTLDPVPLWRKAGFERSKLLLRPHSGDHLYKELGYGGIA